jgi:hypothetical protein
MCIAPLVWGNWAHGIVEETSRQLVVSTLQRISPGDYCVRVFLGNLIELNDDGAPPAGFVDELANIALHDYSSLMGLESSVTRFLHSNFAW